MIATATQTIFAPNIAKAGSEPLLRDFVIAGWIAVLLLALRRSAEKRALPVIVAWLERSRGGGGKAAPALFDGAWIALFNGALAMFAWYTTVFSNSGCTPWATHSCFAAWPAHTATLPQRLLLVLSFSYYLYELAGMAVGVGTALKYDMVAHHVVCMTLFVIGYKTNLFRMAVMWQALFDVSSPILHTAKALHASGVKALEPVKWAAFNLFALSFLVCRVLAGPVSILWPSFTVAPTVLPFSYCYTCWGLILFVYVLQLVWFYKIVQIAVQGDKAAPKAAAGKD